MTKIFDLDINEIWIDEDMSKEERENFFRILNNEMEKVYRFTLTFYEYLYEKRDYGNGEPLSMLEIHILTDVNDNPGMTVTELAKKWKRTTSAVSQIIKSFYDGGLIDRVRNKDDGKVNNLYITDEGKKLVDIHKHYDNIDTIKTLKTLRKEATTDEIEAFFKVAEIYGDIMEGREKGE